MNAGESVVRLESVTRRLGRPNGGASFTLDVPAFALRRGSWTALTGRSGAGKSTLLAILAGLDRADSGRVWMLGEDVTHASEELLARVRRESFGIVLQQPRFLEHLPVWRNVACRLVPLGTPPKEQRERAAAVLDELELPNVLERLPCELSGGEQQRAALARAVVGDPRVLFADEPTSNADAKTSAVIADVLARRRERGATIFVGTHDPLLLAPADERLELSFGRLAS